MEALVMLPSLIQEFYKVLQAASVKLWRNRQQVLNAVVLVIAVIVGKLWYSSEQKQLVMFVGSRGSSSASIGPKIVKQIAMTPNPDGVPYSIMLEPTLENIGIRERMTFETNRIALGMIEDGLSTSTNHDEGGELRALLPMDWDYLFVLCSRRLFDKVAKDIGKPPETLADVIGEVEKGKLYLGSETSSSHWLAKFALDKCDGSPIEKSTKGIADWREMRSAFKNDELELAFFSGPLGSGLIEGLASDNKVVLLGLGNITKAIQQESGLQVYAAELPESSFVPAMSLKQPKAAAEVPFSRPKLSTLASRRVLVCPRSVSKADAFLLASAARTALVEEGYQINLKADDLPFGNNENSASGLRIPIHPGLELLRDGQHPFVWRDWTTWPGWLQAAISILLGLLGIDVLGLLGRRLEVKPSVEQSPPPSPPPSSSNSGPHPPHPTFDEFARFCLTLKEYEDQVDEQTHHETVRQMAEWDRKLRVLKKSINDSKNLTQAQRAMLLQGIRMLRNDIASSIHWTTKSETKRRKDKLPTEPFESETSAEQRSNPAEKQSEPLPDPSVDAS